MLAASSSWIEVYQRAGAAASAPTGRDTRMTRAGRLAALELRPPRRTSSHRPDLDRLRGSDRDTEISAGDDRVEAEPGLLNVFAGAFLSVNDGDDAGDCRTRLR